MGSRHHLCLLHTAFCLQHKSFVCDTCVAIPRMGLPTAMGRHMDCPATGYRFRISFQPIDIDLVPAESAIIGRQPHPTWSHPAH
jgi:hypothetical protein